MFNIVKIITDRIGDAKVGTTGTIIHILDYNESLGIRYVVEYHLNYDNKITSLNVIKDNELEFIKHSSWYKEEDTKDK